LTWKLLVFGELVTEERWYGVYDSFTDHSYGISVFVNLLSLNCNKLICLCALVAIYQIFA